MEEYIFDTREPKDGHSFHQKNIQHKGQGYILNPFYLYGLPKSNAWV